MHWQQPTTRVCGGMLLAIALLAALVGVTRADSAAIDSTYHWGRDAGFFDEVQGFRRSLTNHSWMARDGKAGSFVRSKLDRTLPPGRYLVLLQLYTFGPGVNTVEVQLADAKAQIRHDGAKQKEGYFPALLTTTQPGDQLTVTVKEVGQKEIRLYGVWVSTNLNDGGTWREGMSLGAKPMPAQDRPGNLLAGSSFETGLNNQWGKAVTTSIFIKDDDVIPADDAPHGTHYLRLPGDASSTVTLTHPPVAVATGGPFTLSLHARANQQSGRLSLTIKALSPDERKPLLFQQKIALTDTWQRHHFNFELPATFTGSLQVMIGNEPGKASPSVDVDAIQLERGPLTAYAPAYASEAGVRIVQTPGSIFQAGKPVTLDVALAGGDGDVELVVHDMDWRQVLRRVVHVTTQGSAHVGTTPVSLDLPLAGSYMLTTRSLAGDAAPAVLKAMSILNQLPDDTGSDGLRIGVYGSLTSDSVRSIHRAGFLYSNTLSVEAPIGRMALVAPKQDTFIWQDDVVDRAVQAGVELVVNLGHRYPDWSRDPGKKYPNIESWEAYVSAVMQHYKGRVRLWQVEDEPSDRLPADVYYRMVASARRIAREIDPANRVIMHGDTEKFFAQVMKASGGSHDFYDIMLCGANQPSRTITQANAAHGAGKAVWAATFSSKPSLYAGQPTSLRSVRMIKSFVGSVSSLRADKYMQYDARSSGPSVHQDSLTKSMYEFDGAFRPGGVLYAAAGMVLAGAKPLGPIDAPEGINIHLFARGQERIAVLWANGSPVECKAALGSATRCLDVAGNPQSPKADKDGVTFQLDNRPIYLIGDAGLADALKTIRAQPTLRLSASVRRAPGSPHDFIDVQIDNLSQSPLTGQVTLGLRDCWFAVMGNRRELQQPRPMNIAPGHSAIFSIPCARHPTLPLTGYAIEAAVYGETSVALFNEVPIK